MRDSGEDFELSSDPHLFGVHLEASCARSVSVSGLVVCGFAGSQAVLHMVKGDPINLAESLSGDIKTFLDILVEIPLTM